MSVSRPWLLALWPLLLLAWWGLARRRRGPAVRVGDLGRYVSSAGRWRLWLPAACRALALLALLVGAAGPQVGGRTVQVDRAGISIVMALDISSSMLAEDFAPSNRLEVAKEQAVAFLRGRQSDRVGLVAFAGEALTQVPLTLDYDVLEAAVRELRIGTLEDGTAIGSGLATAVARLRRAPDTSKVVLLLTDGDNNRGLIDPRTAAEAAAAYGIRVYTIGVGTEGEAPIPTGRGLGGVRYEVLPVRIDEPLLTEIAERTGGRYFRARDRDGLQRVFRQIDALEKTATPVARYVRYDEVTAPFAVAGLGFVALELLAAATVAVRAP